jgi:CRISPR-associated protein Cmr3
MAENERQRTVLLQPRDPIIVRDGRPFNADPGARAVSLDWPLPRTVAGALRTHIGKTLGFNWEVRDDAHRAASISVRGPLLAVRHATDQLWRVYVPTPADAAYFDANDVANGKTVLERARPWEGLPQGAGTDLPAGILPLRLDGTGKASERRPRFWPIEAAARWLRLAGESAMPPPGDTLPALPRDARIHVSIDPETRTSRRIPVAALSSSDVEGLAAGLLYGTEAIAFADEPWRPRARHAKDDAGREPGVATAILSRIVNPPRDWQAKTAWVPLGGERRMARLEPVDPDPWPAPMLPPAGGRRLRLLLATPALFSYGWRPGWLEEENGALTGTPPGLSDQADLVTLPKLRLVAAAVGRPVPVSGWWIGGKGSGPRPVRYAVPAGSIYFFELADPSASLTEEILRALWLRPLSDETRDRRDGYGLALPGIW